MGRRRNPRLPWRCSPPPSSAKKWMFQVGSEVEVRSNEDGFSDGWFEATITRLSHKKGRYSVSHDNIVADDAPDEPFKESVHRSLVRPRPPADTTGAVFGIHQCVEAFHNEGWWPGVVCKFLAGVSGNSRDRRYSVCFPATREEFPFKASELRRRLKWVKGNWVSVEDAQEGANVKFGDGTRVEVSRDKENFGAAWFVGTVLKVIGSRYFLIEYENIQVDSDGGTDMLLKEIVDLQYIRPCPPAPMLTDFDILDEVEGFHRNGWFAGVVTVLLPRSQYMVKYKHQEDEMLLNRTSLRPRRVWDDDHWVDISRDRKAKTPAPGGTESAVHKRKSSSGTISASAARDDDHVYEGSNFPSVKRKKEDVPRQKSMTKPSPFSKKSKKRSLSGILSVPVLTYSGNDSETTDVSAVATFKSNEATGPTVNGVLELCKSSKKLKAGNLPEENVLISRRQKSHASEQSSHSTAVLTSHNNDREVHDTLGVTSLKDINVEEPSFQDKSPQSRNKLEEGKTLKEHLQAVNGTPTDCCSKFPAMVGEGYPAAMPILERSPSMVLEEVQSRSDPHERYAQKSKVGANSQAIPSSIELCYGQEESKVTGTNESVIAGEESYSRLDEGPEHQAKEANPVHLPVVHEAVDLIPIADCINGKGNSKPTKTTTRKKRKLTVRRSRRQGRTPDVDEEEEHMGCIYPEMKITFVASNESEPLKEGTEQVVGGEGNSPCNGETLSHKQSHIMVDACETPTESSIVNAGSVKYSAVQQSSTLKSLPTGGEDGWSCASRVVASEAELHPEALPLTDDDHKVAEKENASSAHLPSGSLSSKENNICGWQEITPRRLFDEGPVTGMKHAVCNTTPCGSVPSNEDTHAHDELNPSVFPTGISSSFVSNRSGEIQNSIMEPGENGIKRESALLVGLQENVAPECNGLASAGPHTDGVAFKSSEPTVVADLSPIELPSEALVLPFTKMSSLWQLVESMEVFRLFPQRPHFGPLHEHYLELREGMAIGLMVTYASLVSDMSNLRIGDPKQDFEAKMKILLRMEPHGFSVRSMRTRLERLLQLRSMQISLEIKTQSLGANLTVSEEQQKQNRLLLFSAEKTMTELEQQLTHLGEEKSSMLHELRKIDSKIGILKTGIQAAAEASSSIQQEFNSLLTAPW